MTKRKRIISIVVAGVLAFLAIAGIFVYLATNSSVKTESDEHKPACDVTDENGNELVSGRAYYMPKAMTFATTSALSATSSGGVTITAKITPENATNQDVTWSVSFVNEASEWAKGKTASDYVQITPSGLSCNVKCKKAFGEQIAITVASVEKPTAKATCMADYLKRLINYTLKLSDGTVIKSDDETDIDGEEFPTRLSFNMLGTQRLIWEIECEYSDGTVENECEIESVTMGFGIIYNEKAKLQKETYRPSMIYKIFEIGKYTDAGFEAFEDNGLTDGLVYDTVSDVTDGICLNEEFFENLFGNRALETKYTADGNTYYPLERLKTFFQLGPDMTYMGIPMNFLINGLIQFDVELRDKNGRSEGGRHSILIDAESLTVPVRSVDVDKSSVEL